VIAVIRIVTATAREKAASQSYNPQKFLHHDTFISQKSGLSNRYFPEVDHGCRLDEPLFGFKVLAGSLQFDGSAFRETLPLQAFLE
jgi:hypothetical protein